MPHRWEVDEWEVCRAISLATYVCGSDLMSFGTRPAPVMNSVVSWCVWPSRSWAVGIWLHCLWLMWNATFLSKPFVSVKCPLPNAWQWGEPHTGTYTMYQASLCNTPSFSWKWLQTNFDLEPERCYIIEEKKKLELPSALLFPCQALNS